jgi:hypothetical protein
MTVLLTQNLHFSLQVSGYINAQNNIYWSTINFRQTLQVSLYDQKIGVWCAIMATQIADERITFYAATF